MTTDRTNWDDDIFIIGNTPPPYGGVSVHVANLYAALRKRGISVRLLVNVDCGEGGLQKLYSHLRRQLRIMALLFDANNRYYHDHLFFTVLTSRLYYLHMVVYFFMARKRKAVTTLHSGGFPAQYRKSSPLKRYIFFQILSQFKAVIADSDMLASELLSLGVSKEKIIVIPPFLPFGASDGVHLPGTISRFFDAHSKTMILTGWAYSRLYNFEIGIRVLQKLRNSGIAVGLLILNSGTIVDEGYREELLAEISCAGLDDHVLFVTNLPDITPLYQRAGVLLRLTSHDGNSLSVKEALACGLPVVASDVVARPRGTDIVPLGDFDLICRLVTTILQREKTDAAVDLRLKEEMEGNVTAIIKSYERFLL